MMLSTHEMPSADDVERHLKSVMPLAALSHVEVDGSRSLLILRNENTLAAFGFSDSNISESYGFLYPGFKEFYSQHEREFQSLDLAFVLCAPPTAANIEEVSSSIETDVYFCRKFVIVLTGAIGRSLARLPFLPLSSLEGYSLRPPSAQTLLRRANVPALLARYLVVPHGRGPERLIQDCLKGEFGQPTDLKSSSQLQLSVSGPNFAPVQLDKVTIENFRAYRRPQTFKFGRDLTVLYGPNGFGKTSFFDAIDFAVTGGIGRLRASNEQDLERTATHLDSDPSQSRVSLAFSTVDKSEHTIVRVVDSSKDALLDGEQKDRKAILLALTGGASGDDRIENLVSLFRATHLFSQEQQELTKDFRDDCRLSAQIVSRMLAFEDYANAIAKSSAVTKQLQDRIGSSLAESAGLSNEVAEGQQEMARLGGRRRTSRSGLADEVQAIGKQLAAAGIDADGKGTNLELVRSWRAALATRVADVKGKIEKLSNLSKEAVNSSQLSSQIGSMGQQIKALEAELRAAEDANLASQERHRNAEKKLFDAINTTKAAQESLEAVNRIRNDQPRVRELEKTIDEFQREFDRIGETLKALRDHEGKARSELQASQGREKEVAKALGDKQNDLATVQAWLERLPIWQSGEKRLKEISRLERAKVSLLDGLVLDDQKLVSQIDQLRPQLDQLTNSVAEIERNQAELVNLLSRLQNFVTTGICPLCGDDHGSKDNLDTSIRKRLTEDSVGGLGSALKSVQDQVAELSARLKRNRAQQVSHREDVEGLQKEASSLTESNNQFRNGIARLGLDPSNSRMAQTLKNRATQLQSEQEEAKKVLLERRSKNEEISARLTSLKATIDNTTGRMADVRERGAIASEDAGRIAKEAAFGRITIASDEDQLRQVTQAEQRNLLTATESSKAAQVEIARERAQWGTAERNRDGLRRQLSELRARNNVLSQDLANIRARITEAGLPEDITEQEFVDFISQQAGVEASLATLAVTVANLELGLDAETTAAAYDALRVSIHEKQAAAEDARRQAELSQPWEKYFVSVSELLSAQQNAAIDGFTREYGPRASIIQQRLRAVYGFDDVQISSDDSAIVVRVMRRGRELKPTDYFSQSQQQTLLLGLFLTASSSQNWSAFTPVFLDDPVTHFDDLNTYALLDLIAGLVDPDFGRRQFVISTCDEKVLQLARQKFRYAGDRARFYKFSSIGANGPNVTEISGS
jgi:exonuclease SbcC